MLMRRRRPAVTTLATDCDLCELKPGESALIAAPAAGQDALRERLTHLGFRQGQEISVSRIAPLGDPIAFRVCGAEVCLRRKDARLVAIDRATITSR